MQNFIRRLINFDPRKLTPAQIDLIVIGIVVALAVLNFLLSLANTLLPIVLIGAIGYFGYRWLSSRSEELPPEQRQSRSERVVAEAENNRKPTRRKQDQVTVETSTESTRAQATQNTPTQYEEDSERNLQVEQVVNPETGFKEPNIERLIAEEERKLKEIDESNEDVLAQIEARRKRLLNQSDDDQ